MVQGGPANQAQLSGVWFLDQRQTTLGGIFTYPCMVVLSDVAIKGSGSGFFLFSMFESRDVSNYWRLVEMMTPNVFSIKNSENEKEEKCLAENDKTQSGPGTRSGKQPQTCMMTEDGVRLP